MPRDIKNVAASIHQRLLNAAKASGRPFNEVLQYYAIERFLYRLSLSPFATQFILKGALTLLVWKTPITRPTRDIDLLGRIDNDPENIRAVIAAICRQSVEADGVEFQAATVSTQPIAEHADYHGVRAKFRGTLGSAQIAMQIDIGFSDVITPGPVQITYPTVLDHAPAHLRAYNRETVIAEKFEAMTKLGMLNSRMKDFFDIWLLATNFEFDGAKLALAILNTFTQRASPIAADPVCFSSEFSADPSKIAQWNAFIRTAKIQPAPAHIETVIAYIRDFLGPVALKCASSEPFAATWTPGGPWHAKT